MAVAESAVSGATTGSMFGPWGAVAGAGLGALTSLVGGESDQEKKLKEIMGKLEAFEGEAGETPFSKEEMDVLMKEAQQMFMSSADIASSKVGQAVGESGVAGGQATGEYFTGALSPIVAEGTKLAGQATGQYTQMFANMSDRAKSRMIEILKAEVGANAGMPSMTEFEQVIGSSLGMAGAVSNIGGGLDQLLAEIGKMSAEGAR
jgi:hypothetical protein